MDANKSRLILFPLPFQGHINPMLQLANILHSTGFSISIIHTSYNSPDPSRYPHLSFHVISDGLSGESHDSAPDPVRIINVINANCAEPFRHCVDRIVSEGGGDCPTKCLISDANWYFTQSVADCLGIPRIVMRTSSICSFLAFAALPQLQRKGYLNNRESKMEEAVEELPPLKVKDLPVIEMYNSEDAYRNINTMVEQMKKAAGIIFNTCQHLEAPELEKLRGPPAFVIGPFHRRFSAASSSLMQQDRSSISWLDEQAPRSVLYVSFGSVAAMDGQKLQELAWGLANSMQPFLWAIRPGLIHSSKWVEMLPDGFMEATRERGYC